MEVNQREIEENSNDEGCSSSAGYDSHPDDLLVAVTVLVSGCGKDEQEHICNLGEVQAVRVSW